MFNKKKTVAEIAVDALSHIESDVDSLLKHQDECLSVFRSTADTLRCLNDAIDEKSALCGSLIAQLQRHSDELSEMRKDNEAVRRNILNILGVTEVEVI